jgi:hypothetical protein
MKHGEGSVARRTVMIPNIPLPEQFLLKRRKALHCDREQ